MRRPRVLLADDHLIVAEGLKRLLEPEFELVGVVEDGFALLEVAAEEKPDLIILDVMMPGMDGFEVLDKLRENDDTATIPVIMLTTKDQETDKVWGIRQGAKDYIVKPVKEDDLINRVNAALAGA